MASENKKTNFITGFFKAVWRDFVKDIKRNWLAYLGYFVIIFIPLGYLFALGITEKPERWGLDLAIIPLAIIVVLVYYSLFRKHIIAGLAVDKTAEALHIARDSFKRILYQIIDKALLVGSVYLVYMILDFFTKVGLDLLTTIQFFLIVLVVGSVLIIGNTILNIGRDYNDEGANNG